MHRAKFQERKINSQFRKTTRLGSSQLPKQNHLTACMLASRLPPNQQTRQPAKKSLRNLNPRCVQRLNRVIISFECGLSVYTACCVKVSAAGDSGNIQLARHAQQGKATHHKGSKQSEIQTYHMKRSRRALTIQTLNLQFPTRTTKLSLSERRNVAVANSPYLIVNECLLNSTCARSDDG